MRFSDWSSDVCSSDLHDGSVGGGRGGIHDYPDEGLGTGADHDDRGNYDWLFCTDGCWRPAGPGLFPLADATPGRMGQLRAYGNGLDFETAVAFAGAVKDIMRERNAP